MVSRSQKSEVRNQKKKRGFFGKIWHLMWADFLHYYGRMGRAHYLLQCIVLLVLLSPLPLLGTLLASMDMKLNCTGDCIALKFLTDEKSSRDMFQLSIQFAWMSSLPFLLFIAMSLDIRRLHDLESSAAWIILLYPYYFFMDTLSRGFEDKGEVSFSVFVSILVWMPYFLLLFLPGRKGKNKYGEQPLGWKDV